MTDCARQTFDAMTSIERRNLAWLSFWMDPERARQRGEHLIGPEYQSLQRRAVIVSDFVNEAEGKPVRITDLGRAVLHYIEGGL